MRVVSVNVGPSTVVPGTANGDVVTGTYELHISVNKLARRAAMRLTTTSPLPLCWEYDNKTDY